MVARYAGDQSVVDKLLVFASKLANNAKSACCDRLPDALAEEAVGVLPLTELVVLVGAREMIDWSSLGELAPVAVPATSI